MTERSIIIAERDGTFQINSPEFSDFEMLGVLEQIVFDLKHSKIIKTEIIATPSMTEAVKPEMECPAPIWALTNVSIG